LNSILIKVKIKREIQKSKIVYEASVVNEIFSIIISYSSTSHWKLS